MLMVNNSKRLKRLQPLLSLLPHTQLMTDLTGGWMVDPISANDPRCTVSDICLAKSPCQNGGTCESHGEGNYTCRCVDT